MQIRRATIQDAPAIIENNILLAKESENEILTKSSVKKGVEKLLTSQDKGFYLVVTIKNSIIGQLMITYEWSDWRNTNIWWIQSVYVHKDHRRKGVFSSLLNEIKKQAKKQDVSTLRLYVHNDNVSAQQVYEQCEMNKGTYVIFETPVD